MTYIRFDSLITTVVFNIKVAATQKISVLPKNNYCIIELVSFA